MNYRYKNKEYVSLRDGEPISPVDYKKLLHCFGFLPYHVPQNIESIEVTTKDGTMIRICEYPSGKKVSLYVNSGQGLLDGDELHLFVYEGEVHEERYDNGVITCTDTYMTNEHATWTYYRFRDSEPEEKQYREFCRKYPGCAYKRVYLGSHGYSDYWGEGTYRDEYIYYAVDKLILDEIIAKKEKMDPAAGGNRNECGCKYYNCRVDVTYLVDGELYHCHLPEHPYSPLAVESSSILLAWNNYFLENIADIICMKVGDYYPLHIKDSDKIIVPDRRKLGDLRETLKKRLPLCTHAYIDTLLHLENGELKKQPIEIYQSIIDSSFESSENEKVYYAAGENKQREIVPVIEKINDAIPDEILDYFVFSFLKKIERNSSKGYSSINAHDIISKIPQLMLLGYSNSMGLLKERKDIKIGILYRKDTPWYKDESSRTACILCVKRDGDEDVRIGRKIVKAPRFIAIPDKCFDIWEQNQISDIKKYNTQWKLSFLDMVSFWQSLEYGGYSFLSPIFFREIPNYNYNDRTSFYTKLRLFRKDFDFDRFDAEFFESEHELLNRSRYLEYIKDLLLGKKFSDGSRYLFLKKDESFWERNFLWLTPIVNFDDLLVHENVQEEILSTVLNAMWLNFNDGKEWDYSLYKNPDYACDFRRHSMASYKVSVSINKIDKILDYTLDVYDSIFVLKPKGKILLTDRKTGISDEYWTYA